MSVGLDLSFSAAKTSGKGIYYPLSEGDIEIISRFQEKQKECTEEIIGRLVRELDDLNAANLGELALFLEAKAREIRGTGICQ